MDYILPNWGSIAGNIMILSVPGVDYNFPEVSLKDRKYPLLYYTSLQKRYCAEIEIPEGYTSLYVPEDVNINNEHFTFCGEYREEGNKVYFNADFSLLFLQM